ncbi:MAG: hypothetical protein GXX91_08010 [Verrucomicrobiaceae bacterium]|nr:hypothetical protein [Verrucomicrobiaceae bacterium]
MTVSRASQTSSLRPLPPRPARRRTRPGIASALVLSLALAGTTLLSAQEGDSGKTPPLEAGAAAVDITPQAFPVLPRGSFSPRPVDSVHDPLHARALALRSGKDRVVICVVDVIYIVEPTNSRIREEAAAATGWPVENILLAGTHTHSAPSPYPRHAALLRWWDNGEDNPDAPKAKSEDPAPETAFQKRTREGTVAAIVQAVENLEPASIAFGTHDVPDEVRNRRWYLEEGTMPPNPFGGIDTVKMNPNRSTITKPAGPVDPEVATVSVKTAKGKALAVLSNYSLHYVGGTGGQISADYFGEFARLVAYRVGGRKPPENFVGILSNGTSGDINNSVFSGTRPPRAPYEQITQVATKVADAAYLGVKEAEYVKSAPLAMRQRTVTLRCRRPDAERIAWAEKVLTMEPKEVKEAGMNSLAPHYAARILQMADYPETVDVTIQAIRIGEQAIVSIPFEVLVEIGLELKEKSPFPNTFTIELANGAYGYLPPPNQHDLGGYETWMGTNYVTPDSSGILVKELLEMLGELRE